MSTKVTVHIETKAGPDSLTLDLGGEESGDNPRFNAAQVEGILSDIAVRVRQMFHAYYGGQQ